MKLLSQPLHWACDQGKGLARLQAKTKPGSRIFMPSRMQKSVREKTLTLPSELPSWELESRWNLECSKSDYKGQNPMVRGILHIIGKLLKLKCLKWAHMTHLDIWNTNYGLKKGRESNWQFDSRSLKVGNQPNFLVCRWFATYHWKACWELECFFRPHLN